MKVSPSTLLTATIAAFVGQAAAAAVEPTETTAAHPCTTGSPVVSYGYTINYALATPTAEAQARGGYEPDPSWSSAHLLGTQVSFEFPSSCPSIYFPNVFPIAVLSHQRSTNHLSLLQKRLSAFRNPRSSPALRTRRSSASTAATRGRPVASSLSTPGLGTRMARTAAASTTCEWPVSIPTPPLVVVVILFN